MIIRRAKGLARKLLNRLGYEVVRSGQHPIANLMGLRNFSINTVLDIGANTGQFATQAAEWFPGAAILSFEPIPEAYASLKTRVFPKAREFRAFNVAIGDFDGEAKMNATVNDTTSSSLLKTTTEFTDFLPVLAEQKVIRVEVRRLDSLVREAGLALEPNILIKTDVQGFEDSVIRGGKETFKKASASIVEVIFDNYYERQATFSGIVHQFDELGFQYAGNLGQYHHPDGHVAVVDACFIRRPREEKCGGSDPVPVR